MAKSDQDKLGAILYAHGNKYICEGGISDGKKTILWDEIQALYWDASKHTNVVNFIPIPTYEEHKIYVVSLAGYKMNLTQFGLFRLSKGKMRNFWDLYQFIVSKIIDRQWLELTRAIEKGERISFGSFDITSTVIYRKKFLGYEPIDVSRIIGFKYSAGIFRIGYTDDKGHLHFSDCGFIGEIPNIHLAQAFISSVVQQKRVQKSTPNLKGRQEALGCPTCIFFNREAQNGDSWCTAPQLPKMQGSMCSMWQWKGQG